MFSVRLARTDDELAEVSYDPEQAARIYAEHQQRLANL